MEYCFHCRKTVSPRNVAILCKPIPTKIPAGVCGDGGCLCLSCLHNANPRDRGTLLPEGYSFSEYHYKPVIEDFFTVASIVVFGIYIFDKINQFE